MTTGLSSLPALALLAVAGTAAAQEKVILAHYMPWYETPEISGRWGEHWTGFNDEADPTQIGPDGRRDIWSNYYPLIEPYDSRDPDLLECHLLQMKLAGIDGVIVDWYGLSNAADYPEIHTASRAMFSAAGDMGMKFVAMFEDRTVELLVNTNQLQPSQITTHLTQTFQWVAANWFSQPHYHRVNGQPLFMNFGPIFVNDPAPWNTAFAALPEDPQFHALHNLWTGINADGAFMWVHPDIYNGNPSPATIKQRLNNLYFSVSGDPAKVIPSVCPNFDDVYIPGGLFPPIDDRGGQTFQEALEVAMDGPWETIQLVTWNDYGEGTIIEPSREFGYTYLEMLQDARRAEQGAAFTFTADDLRLPATLYALRKEGTTPGATLDQIAASLTVGDTDEARAQIALLTGEFFESGPSSAVTDEGGVLTFAAELVTGVSPIGLTWTKDGVAIVDDARVSGANTTTLTISPAEASDNATYQLTVDIGGLMDSTATAVGAVRVEAGGDPADLDGNSVVDVFDLIAFLQAFSQALGN